MKLIFTLIHRYISLTNISNEGRMKEIKKNIIENDLQTNTGRVKERKKKKKKKFGKKNGQKIWNER